MINRRTFATMGAAALATPGLLRAQTPQTVIVVGAGSAGMTAAIHLRKAGIDVRVLEASNRVGGRTKRDTTLADVPLDLGAEWIHTDPTVLGEMLGEGETTMGVETIVYRPETYQFYNDGVLKDFDALRFGYEEVKFLDTTWYGFFDRFVLPEIADVIDRNAPVASIAPDGAGVRVQTVDGRSYLADRVLVTVPISILKRGGIQFLGGLENNDLGALRDVAFGKGFKVFMTFRDRFYPDMLYFGSRWSILADAWDSKLYYDAAFGKPTDQNVLGLFTVAEGELPRADLSNEALVNVALEELTEIYGSVVSRGFIAGIAQNWTQETYVGGSYSMTNNSWEDITDILAPSDNRVFFAGEALGGDYQSTVHGAAFSAIDAVAAMLDG